VNLQISYNLLLARSGKKFLGLYVIQISIKNWTVCC